MAMRVTTVNARDITPPLAIAARTGWISASVVSVECGNVAGNV
jgi:hypothetical protein